MLIGSILVVVFLSFFHFSLVKFIMFLSCVYACIVRIAPWCTLMFSCAYAHTYTCAHLQTEMSVMLEYVTTKNFINIGLIIAVLYATYFRSSAIVKLKLGRKHFVRFHNHYP